MKHKDWCNTQRMIPPGALAERGPCNCAPVRRRNDNDRKQWVNNDEELYLWWLSTRLPIHTFVVQNRAELDMHIDAYLNRQPRS